VVDRARIASAASSLLRALQRFGELLHLPTVDAGDVSGECPGYPPARDSRSVSRGVRPQGTVGTGNAFIVQTPGDRTRADAGGEGVEDTANDLDLRGVDGALAAIGSPSASVCLTTS
jgi:hypothetical protein